ncbi:MAG TPA: hypothetical protein PK395_02670 [bacterium]|nr:hypothetical protein [bacterium]
MIRFRKSSILALLMMSMAVPVYAQYGGGMGGMGMGMGGMGMGMGGMGMGMGGYGFGMGGYGGAGGAQVPNFVIVKEGEAIYCAVYGDLIDYQVYVKQVPVDEVAGNYYDDGTHGDEVAFDGVPSKIEENRDKYLGPFAIRYKKMLEKVLVDAMMTVMDEGSFAMFEKARAKALLDNREVLFDQQLDPEQFKQRLTEFTIAVLEKGKAEARDPKLVEQIDQTIRMAQNKLLLEILGNAREAWANQRTVRRRNPLEYFRIPVTADSVESGVMKKETIVANLTSKVEDWTQNFLGQFIGPDGEPYDDEKYRFELNVQVLQNQQGLGVAGYGSGGGYMGGGGGPPGMYAVDRARNVAEIAGGGGSDGGAPVEAGGGAEEAP